MSLKNILSQSLIWRVFYVITVLLQNVFFSRYFQAENSGWIYYLTNVFGFVVIITSLSLDSGFTYFTANGTIKTAKAQLFSLVWTAIIAITGVLTSGFFILLIPHHYPINDSTLLFYTVVYVSGMMLTNYLLALFYSVTDYFLPNVIIGAINVVIVLFIPKYAHLVDAGNSKLLLAYFMLPCIQALILFVAFTIKNNTLFSLSLPSRDHIKKIVTFSLVALGANIIFYLMNRADYYFVQTYCSKQDLGNYILVSRLAQMMLIIPQVLASVVFPQVAIGTDQGEVVKTIIYLTRLMSRLYLIMLIVSIFVGKMLFTAVFGSTFNTMHIFLVILLPGIFSLSVLALISAFFLGIGNVKVNFIGTIFGLIILVIGDTVLVPFYGAVAAAAVSSVAYFVNMLYALHFLKKNFRLSFVELLTWKKDELSWLKSFKRSSQ